MEAHFTDVDMAVSRSALEMPDEDPIREVENLYVDQIAAARPPVYAESQYFASRRIAEAIAKRLEELNGPVFVVVNPLTAQGYLDPLAMDTERALFLEALRRPDRHGRLRIRHLFTDVGEATTSTPRS